jgi:hypothetical protein
MKNLHTKPGFEVIFSLSVFTIICLPPLVMAQTQKTFEVEIINGDTTINGKDIKKLNGLAASIRPFRLNNRNTQNFDYVNTDNDGVSTNMHFTVTDVTLNDRKKPLGELDENYLAVHDLNISPEFSTDKINLSFTLPEKSAAEVTLWDYDVVLWTEKVSGGSFNKKVSFPKDGDYSLTIKQGTKSVTKQVLKQN